MSKSSTSRAVMQVEPRVLHIGVDLGLEKNAVVVIDERAQGVDRFSFSQDRSGYDYFLQRVEMLRQKQQASSLAVAMEPTNYFWKLLARELEGKEIPYHLVNAYTVKKHREGDQLDRSKDDRRDAGQIAELSRTGHYTKTRLQQGAYEDLRQYAALYDQTNRSIRRERQLLWVLVGQVFPELFQAFCSLEGETCQALLRTCASAAAIRQVTVDALVSQVRSAYPGKKLGVKKLRQIHELSATSIGVTEGISAIQAAIQAHLNFLQVLLQQADYLTRAMSNCLGRLPEAPYLRSILGEVSTAMLLAEVGDPARYQTAAQWVKLAGIQPAPNTSGKKQRSRTPMSRQGRSRLRTLLYFACLRLIQHDHHFAQLYTHLQRRQTNPLTKMQAIGVLMNKLLHILWALIHNHSFYNPSFSPPA